MWVDTDMVCIKPFAFGDKFTVGWQGNQNAEVNNAVLGGVTDLWRMLSDACRAYPKIMAWDGGKTRKRKIIRRLQFGGREGAKFVHVGGPYVLTEALRHFDLIKLAKPSTYFYPIYHEQADTIFDDTYSDGYDFGEHGYGLHLWNERARRHGHDKNADFAHGSLIEQLKRKHKIT